MKTHRVTTSPHLNLLRNRVDVTRVPFSDRGSRLLVFQEPGQSRLLIKLAERLTGLQPDIDAYRHRPPFIRDLCLLDEQGEALDFEVVTYPHVLYFRTRLGDFGLVFHDKRTLVFGLPPQVTAGLRFHVSPQFWEKTERGGAFKAVRNLTYASNGEPIHNQITPDAGGYTVEFTVQAGNDCAIALTIHESPCLPFDVLPFSASYTAAEARWHDWFSRVPPVDERYRLTYAYVWWIMANNLISPQGKVVYEAMTPSKINYVGLWLWDSAMHALAYRHVDPELARNQIRAMLACQLPDGMLPDAVYDEGIISTIEHPIYSEVTKPPILAWAALKLHEADPDLEFLQEIYVPLVRWNAWWFSMNDDDVDGLAQYNHPYSSGLDDSPLWEHGMPVESPDLNTYLCVQMGSLATMAKTLGMDAEGAMWRRRAAAIVRRMIKDFWDEDAGLFRALHEEQPIPVVTPFNLYPLWTGQLPDAIRDRLIAHLVDSDEFGGEYVIPTVARNDRRYDPETMWRGPVWANINYFFIEALHQVGEHALARTLREKTLELIMSHPSIYEYYNSQTGQPAVAAAETFGWTAAVFIDLAIQASQEESTEWGNH
ncbi:MAG: trehalase family glycosidase [Chloroflexota bacterium]|nr:trehalase family glycosidase [Chloroflexota bacterium]